MKLWQCLLLSALAHAMLGLFVLFEPAEVLQLDRRVTFSAGAQRQKKAEQATLPTDSAANSGIGQGASTEGRFQSDVVVQRLTKQIQNEIRYPMMARRLCQQGRTRLKVTVGPDGSVTGVSVFKTSGFDTLDKAAIKAVRGFRFSPGEASETFLLRPIRFQLEGC